MPQAAALAQTLPKSGGYRVTALIIAAALFMEQLDGTVLATALPDMARSFNVSPLRMNVALTAYLLSLAVFIPASGHVADRFGARTVFRAAIALFTVGSVLCAQSVSLPMLVASRVLQGIGGAMMVPVGRIVLLRAVARHELVSAMSWMLVPAQIGPVVGPPLGGFFVTYLSWRWIFYINLPIGLIGMVLASLFIEEYRAPTSRRFDWIGFVLSGVSLASLLFGFEMASRNVTPWPVTAGLLAIGVLTGALYLRHANHAPQPILNVRLMSRPSFRISVIAGSLTRITAGAMPFLLPMTLQLGLGLSAAQSGLVTLASGGGAMVMKAAAPPILRRFGYRDTLTWNCVIATSLIASLALLSPRWPIWLMLLVIFTGGFFQSLQFTAFNTVAYADIATSRVSSATSFYATFQQLMLSAGICVAATALAASLALHHRTSLVLGDFSIAWLTVGAITLLAVPICRRLSPDAGNDMTGHSGRK